MIHLITQDFVAETLPVVSAILLGGALVWLIVCGTVLFIVDLREHRLPNRWTGALWAVGGILLVTSTLLAPAASQLADRWSMTLLGSLGYLAVMFLLHLLTRSGIGMGDVKLAAGLGLYLGYLGLEAVLAGFVLAFLVGGLQALYLVVFRGAKKSTRIAFGPAMLIGCAVTMLM